MQALVQIILKLIPITNDGNELKKLSEVMTFSEGQMESFFSLGLQLIIIMKISLQVSIFCSIAIHCEKNVMNIE